MVVVNTHLYGAHLASGGDVLPEHDVVVFDEAHELEDIAAASLGLELGAGRFRSAGPRPRGPSSTSRRRLADDLGERRRPRRAGARAARRPPAPRPLDGRLDDVVTLGRGRAGRRLRRRAVRGEAGDGDARRKQRALQAAGHLAGDLALIRRRLPETDVAWVEGPAHAPVLKRGAGRRRRAAGRSAVGHGHRRAHQRHHPARLPGGSASPARATSSTSAARSTTSTRRCSTARPTCPTPATPTYEPAMHDELEALIEAAGGRTLALFTSWRAMQRPPTPLAAAVPYRCSPRPTCPSPRWSRRSPTDETSCLFATMGFWQGVDVPGAACRS